MVPYKLLGGDAPLAEAFNDKGLKYVSVLISIGAIAGLTTTLMVGLYVQVSSSFFLLSHLSGFFKPHTSYNRQCCLLCFS